DVPPPRGRELAPVLVALRDVELGADAGVEPIAVLERGARLGVLLLGEQPLALLEQLIGAIGVRRARQRADREARDRQLHGITVNTPLSSNDCENGNWRIVRLPLWMAGNP